jgi:alpha-N-arabinofuranosidase
MTTREFHVALSGADTHPGSAAKPWRTIGHASAQALPGDTITVHAGIYRESIDPPRGGGSDASRIVYQAAPGERVEIAGSEIVTGWKPLDGGIWQVELPNSFFGGFNPFADLIHGDWFVPLKREHHTGAVYLDGHWRREAASLEELQAAGGEAELWFGRVDGETTMIWACFGQTDPNQGNVEINVRRTVFYPARPGINFITVRGFVLRHAATPWAPPTAEQPGLIGTHWSKGWIIEGNTVCYSRCTGITLGKYGDEYDNTGGGTEGYIATVKRALTNGWNRETVGSHIVRKNIVCHCEQAGIIGSLGAAFSEISGNVIHDIHVHRLFQGEEQAGLKFHGAVDSVLRGNRIFRCYRGIWLDWMTQGTRVTGNLCHDNVTHDLLSEVNHGPYLVDHNVFLSVGSLDNFSNGGAFAHNLFAGKIERHAYHQRETPYLLPHATGIAGFFGSLGGDDLFLNNLVVDWEGLAAACLAAKLPVMVGGNHRLMEKPDWTEGNEAFLIQWATLADTSYRGLDTQLLEQILGHPAHVTGQVFSENGQGLARTDLEGTPCDPNGVFAGPWNKIGGGLWKLCN